MAPTDRVILDAVLTREYVAWDLRSVDQEIAQANVAPSLIVILVGDQNIHHLRNAP